MLTNPSIAVAQNRDDSLRMLAAQARLYSDVKRDSSIRLVGVAVVAVALATASLVQNDDAKAIGAIGGVILLFGDGLLMYRERRRTGLAVSIQETFDCSVFGLTWNDLAVRSRPSGQQVAKAAARYAGTRTRDWYPDTGTVQRPLDIAICQQSNVGWGAPVHRAWAWCAMFLATFVSAVLIGVWEMSGVSAWRGVDALIVPFVPLAWEAFENVRHNFESAREKEETQSLILTDWAGALSGITSLSESRCRGYQDEIVRIRRRNALVPDWFDKCLRGRNEQAMRTTASDMIAEAERVGRA